MGHFPIHWCYLPMPGRPPPPSESGQLHPAAARLQPHPHPAPREGPKRLHSGESPNSDSQYNMGIYIFFWSALWDTLRSLRATPNSGRQIPWIAIIGRSLARWNRRTICWSSHGIGAKIPPPPPIPRKLPMPVFYGKRPVPIHGWGRGDTPSAG